MVRRTKQLPIVATAVLLAWQGWANGQMPVPNYPYAPAAAMPMPMPMSAPSPNNPYLPVAMGPTMPMAAPGLPITGQPTLTNQPMLPSPVSGLMGQPVLSPVAPETGITPVTGVVPTPVLHSTILPPPTATLAPDCADCHAGTTLAAGLHSDGLATGAVGGVALSGNAGIGHGFWEVSSPGDPLCNYVPMIGDVIEPRFVITFANKLGQFDPGDNRIAGILDYPLGRLRRARISENGSMLPRTRAYITYRHNHNTLDGQVFDEDRAFLVTDSQTNHLDEFVFGFEKAFFNGNLSIEARIPTAKTLENTTVLETNRVPRAEDWQEGNIWLALKLLIKEWERAALSGGLAVNLPTGDDVEFTINEPSGAYVQNFDLQNNLVSLTPYLGFIAVPTDRFWVQGIAQLDVPVRDFDVNLAVVDNLQRIRYDVATTLDDQTTAAFDLGTGIWLRRRPGALVSGIAGMLELHYQTTLEDGDSAALVEPITLIQQGTIGDFDGETSIFNLTAGGALQLRDTSTLSLGVVVPLFEDPNRTFDWALAVQLNYFF